MIAVTAGASTARRDGATDRRRGKAAQARRRDDRDGRGRHDAPSRGARRSRAQRRRARRGADRAAARDLSRSRGSRSPTRYSQRASRRCAKSASPISQPHHPRVAPPSNCGRSVDATAASQPLSAVLPSGCADTTSYVDPARPQARRRKDPYRDYADTSERDQADPRGHCGGLSKSRHPKSARTFCSPMASAQCATGTAPRSGAHFDRTSPSPRRPHCGIHVDDRVASWRHDGHVAPPAARHSAENYYLIVEAITPSGGKLKLPVRNEETETQRDRTSSPFASRKDVRSSVHRQARRRHRAAEPIRHETRGTLAVEYLMPFDGGTITKW